MADVRAFRAYRYDLGQVGALSDVVAPPYDVIDPALQRALYDRSPYNVIRLILNQETREDSEINNRYTRASRCLRDWQQEGILKKDSARALFVYHQEFEIEGNRHTRRGFLARVRLEPFGTGRIFPHEETFPGPKADRLKLFRATAMNLSPIFGLFPDEEGLIQQNLDAAVGRSLPLEAMDHLGVKNRLWPVTDQHTVSTVTGLMGPKPLFIADGHHRYETGLEYLEERRVAGEVSDAEAAPNFILMMLVSMSDPGLVILPTHRLLFGMPDLTAGQLRGLVEGLFQIEDVGSGSEAAQDAWELIQADGGQDLMAFGTATDCRWQMARFRSAELMKALAPEHSPAWHSLGVSILHLVVLNRLLDQAGFSPQCRYVHKMDEVMEAMSSRQCQVAALVPPATMTQVEQIAGNLEKMPPKSTFFYPKVLSGLVFNSLKGT